MTLLCCYPPGSRAGLLGCLQPNCTLAYSNSTSAGLLSGLLERCSRKQIPRKQTLSLGNWNAVGSNKQTLCNEDLGLCCQQVQQVLHIKSSWGLLAPKNETPQRSCHLRFHIVPPHHFLQPTTLLPFLSLWQESIFIPFKLAKNTFPSCPTGIFKSPNRLCGKGRWWGAAPCLQGSGNISPFAAVLAAQWSRSQSDVVPRQDAALQEHTWAVCTPQATNKRLWSHLRHPGLNLTCMASSPYHS